MCENGHVYKSRISNHITLSTGEKRSSCPICNNKFKRSKPELEIEEYVKSLGYVTELKHIHDSSRKWFEIDIYIPEKNVGIEYNGS